MRWNFPDVDPAVQAERDRMAAERDARVAEMRAAEHAETVLPVLRLADQLEAVIPPERVPVLIHALRGVVPATLDRALSQLETRHARREREHARLVEAETTVVNLRSLSRRRAESNAGAL